MAANAYNPSIGVNICRIEITNFKRIGNTITVNFNNVSNNLIGLDQELKKEIPAAIIFALGATANQVQKAQLSNIPHENVVQCRVRLTLASAFGLSSVTRVINPQEPIEQYFINKYIEHEVDRDEYMGYLKDLKFDLDKQIHFYDAANRTMFWNMITSEQDELIGVLTDKSQTIRDMAELDVGMQKLKLELKAKVEKESHQREEHDKLFNFHDWTTDDSHYAISYLRREEAERNQKKGELQSVENDLNTAEVDCATLQDEIHLVEAEKNDRIVANERSTSSVPISLQPFINLNIETLKIRMITWRNKIEQNEHLISEKRAQLKDIERYKTVDESHINFMNSATGTQRSNMISEDALLKLYPIYHGSDELEKAKQKLKLLKKEESLNDMKAKNDIFEYYETALPQRRVKPMEENGIETIFDELQNALKALFDPNSLLFTDDDVKFELFNKAITDNIGVILYNAFQPTAAEHTNLINNILSDFKYTVVLYSNAVQSMFTKLNKLHPDWFQNVHFILISELPSCFNQPLRPLHWLNYASFNAKIPVLARRRIRNYITTRLNIFCVESHEEVRNEFERRTKKYVASTDGQLIYTINMNIDVLRYFKPGKKRQELHFPEATQRLTDAFKKLGQLVSSSIETENIPRVNDVGIDDNLQREVVQLKNDLEEKEERRRNQMEALRRRMDEPYTAPQAQNYTQAIVEEQDRLNEINQHIATLNNEIDSYRQETARLGREIHSFQDVINRRTQFDRNESEIEKLKETIKKKKEELNRNYERIRQLKGKQDLLENDIRNLKYRTIRTVQKVFHQRGNTNFTVDIMATTPPTLINDITNGVYIDPKVISIQFVENGSDNEPNIILGNESWNDRFDVVETELSTLNADIRRLKEVLRLKKASYATKKGEVDAAFELITGALNLILNEVANSSCDDCGVGHIEIKFEYKQRTDTRKMITVRVDSVKVAYENFTHDEQSALHWIVFTAFHRLVHAPFVFIDLTDVNKDISDSIDQLINKIAEHSQMFINASHIYHLPYATFQIGVHVKVEPSEVFTVELDSEEYVQRQDAFQEVPEDESLNNYQHNPQGNPQDDPQDNLQDNNNQDNSQDNPEDNTQDNPQGIPQDNPQENPQDNLQDYDD